MGARGAPKTGGRKKGSLNRRTLERALASQLDAIRGNRTEEALAALERYQGIAEGAAGRYRKRLDNPQTDTDANAQLFKDFLQMAIYCAKERAPYFKPRYRAVAVMITPTDNPAPLPQIIEHEPRDEGERERRASDSYLKLVKG